MTKLSGQNSTAALVGIRSAGDELGSDGGPLAARRSGFICFDQEYG